MPHIPHNNLKMSESGVTQPEWILNRSRCEWVRLTGGRAGEGGGRCLAKFKLTQMRQIRLHGCGVSEA